MWRTHIMAVPVDRFPPTFQGLFKRTSRAKFEWQVGWDQSWVTEVFCLLRITTSMWDACYRLVNMKAKQWYLKNRHRKLSESYEPPKDRFHVLKTVCMIWKVRDDTCAMLLPHFQLDECELSSSIEEGKMLDLYKLRVRIVNGNLEYSLAHNMNPTLK